MDTYGPIGSVGSGGPIHRLPGRHGHEGRVAPFEGNATRVQARIHRPGDRLEIGLDAGGVMSPSIPESRQEVIQRVRGEIRAGTYESEERLGEAAAALLDRLRLMI